MAKKGAKRGSKRDPFGALFHYFLGKGGFIKIDDSIERNAYFCLPREVQKAPKIGEKRVAEKGTLKVCL